MGVHLVQAAPAAAESGGSVKRPNVLFVMADDLNDWRGSGALTPNLDRLAARAVTFSRAYCVVPACGPSRTSLLTGLTPGSTGVYFNSQPLALSPVAAAATDLPAAFKAAGYLTASFGKFFHHRRDQDDKAGSWTEGHYRGYSAAADAAQQKHAAHRVSIGDVWPESWGWYSDEWDRDDPEKMQQDTRNSRDAAEMVARQHDRPFFVALGLFRPHSKWYVAKRYFDLYPKEALDRPDGWREGDLSDVPAAGRWLAQINVTPETNRVLDERGLWRDAIQAYLASITYADEQIGRVLDALEAGPNGADTIIVFSSDHGYHLGEKEHWNKFTLWERSARVPLLISAPGVARTARAVAAPVSLLDLYPTLVDLAGIAPADSHRLEGVTLRPLLEGKASTRGAPVVTTQGRGNHSVRDERWRYIRYRNGEEELYDHDVDPHEWRNLAAEARHRPVMDRLAQQFPALEAPNAPCQDARRVDWLSREIFGEP